MGGCSWTCTSEKSVSLVLFFQNKSKDSTSVSGNTSAVIDTLRKRLLN